MALTNLTKVAPAGLKGNAIAGQVLKSDGQGGVVFGTGAGGGLSADDTLSNLLFIHYGGFTSNTTIDAPRKFVEIFTHPDATIDIDNGVTVDIDDQCILITTDKTEFDIDFFASGISGTNLQRASSFDDNVRTTVSSNLSLSGKAKVGYSQIPSFLQTEVPFDIENSVTLTVDDGAVLVI